MIQTHFNAITDEFYHRVSNTMIQLSLNLMNAVPFPSETSCKQDLEILG